MMMVYEVNYKRLMQLVPDLRSISGSFMASIGDIPDICLNIQEHCKYTTILSLTHHLRIDGKMIPDLDMKLRVYHDAKLVEVIGYQFESRFAPYYPYPNPKMRQHFEKRQINLFLSEWLKYCEVRGVRFTRHTNETTL